MALIVWNRSVDPAYNLALEEYMIDRKTEDVIMLWRNSDAVIVGRNQNVIEEIDVDFVKEKNIAVIRRLTGGGAVFHDLGNVNFTFIKKNSDGMFSDYAGFTAPVRDYLRTLGAKCELSGRNDLMIEDMKISGNAQTVRNGRIMHHGTLLFSSDMSRLSGALRVRDIKAQSRGIKSYRSRVTNINEHIRDKNMSVEKFIEGLYGYFCENAEGAERYEISEADDAEVKRLVAEKYGTWEWNFGNAPKYDYHNVKKYPFGVVEVYLSTEGATVEKAQISGDFFGVKEIAELCGRLVGVKHSADGIKAALADVKVGDFISGMTEEELVGLILE